MKKIITFLFLTLFSSSTILFAQEDIQIKQEKGLEERERAVDISQSWRTTQLDLPELKEKKAYLSDLETKRDYYINKFKEEYGLSKKDAKKKYYDELCRVSKEVADELAMIEIYSNPSHFK